MLLFEKLVLSPHMKGVSCPNSLCFSQNIGELNLFVLMFY
ncbi:hypothetical protein VCRA2120O6_100034 [Vibrio crassostreae]|nr:hypothetical protein VCRA2120O6_100034 [Vibrio crassostreae]